MTTVLRDRPGAADEPSSTPRRPFRLRGDLLAVAVASLLVTASALVGWALIDAGVPVLVGWPPLLAQWLPHVGPGTVPAVLVALVVALGGPAVARSCRWGPLLAVAYVASLAWTFALATIDGWFVGVAERLATPTEYLAEIPRTPDIAVFLQTFAERIAGQTPDTLVTHASGHPPAATIFYVLLDRAGFPGGEYAGAVTAAIGASAVVAVAITLAALGDRDLARTYLPFGVLFPGAVWVGVSADGMFAAILAWGVALLALGAVRRGLGGHALCLLAGVVLGLSLFFSYGLVLAGLLPVAVALCSRRILPLVTGGDRRRGRGRRLRRRRFLVVRGLRAGDGPVLPGGRVRPPAPVRVLGLGQPRRAAAGARPGRRRGPAARGLASRAPCRTPCWPSPRRG